MNAFFRHSALLAIVASGLLAAAAAPAQATMTPFNAALVTQSTNIMLISSGIATSCPVSTLTGRVSADGRSVTATVDAHGDGRGRTCVDSIFRGSCTVTIRGDFIVFSTASVANTSASFNVSLAANFNATITCPSFSRSVLGPQALGSCATFGQGMQTLNFGCNAIDTNGTTVLWSGSYRVISPNWSVS